MEKWRNGEMEKWIIRTVKKEEEKKLALWWTLAGVEIEG